MSEISLTIDPPEVDDREEEEAKWMKLYCQQFSSESLVQPAETESELDAELYAESETESEEEHEERAVDEADEEIPDSDNNMLPDFLIHMVIDAPGDVRPVQQPAARRRRSDRYHHVFRYHGPNIGAQNPYPPIRPIHRRRGLPENVSDSEDEDQHDAASAGYDYRTR